MILRLGINNEMAEYQIRKPATEASKNIVWLVKLTGKIKRS